MKKVIAMLLALVMALSLCACGGKDVGGTVTATDKTPVMGETVSGPAEEAEEEPEAQVQLGVQSGGRYENAFLGIGCELDENWTFGSREELAELAGQTMDMFEDEDLSEQLKSLNLFYDMYAYADEGLVTMNIIIQNLGVLYGTVITEEQLLELSSKDLESQMASAGFSNVQWERRDVEFAGAERVGLYMISEVQGMTYYCQQIYMKQGSYMACVTLASFQEDITPNLTEYFFAL